MKTVVTATLVVLLHYSNDGSNSRNSSNTENSNDKKSSNNRDSKTTSNDPEHGI